MPSVVWHVLLCLREIGCIARAKGSFLHSEPQPSWALPSKHAPGCHRIRAFVLHLPSVRHVGQSVERVTKAVTAGITSSLHILASLP